MNKFYSILLLLAVVLVSGCVAQTSEDKPAPDVEGGIEFKVLDQALNEVGAVKLDVTIPLDNNEACQIAKSAAEVHGLEEFECDDTIRVRTPGEITVVDDTTIPGEFATAVLFRINEDAKTVSLSFAP